MLGSNRKRSRFGSNPRLSTLANIETCTTDGTLTEITQKPLGFFKPSSTAPPPPFVFNDSSTADVLLHLRLDSSPDHDSDLDPDSLSSADSATDVKLYLHSDVLRRSQYFAALLSDRWRRQKTDDHDHHDDSHKLLFNHVVKVPASAGSVDAHLTVLQLLYTDDFYATIDSVSVALSIIPVALELLFEDCVRACVRFLEAVPWTEEEENKVLSIIPLLSNEESRELVARVLPSDTDLSEEMLYSLILAAIYNHQNMAYPKAFVAKLLRDFSSRDSARRVLDRAFDMSLSLMKESIESYSSPDFREYYEPEAIQRVSLQSAMTNGRHLLWLIERMIELRVADKAAKEWSEQASFTTNLQWAFRDDSLRNIMPGLPAVVLRCTSRLANAISSGSVLASRQVRMKLVKDWLPVLIMCRSKMLGAAPSQNQSLYQELEETFLKIISTLPMSDAQELLPQCLTFTTRNVEDCPHLVSAFNTWFRRAARTPLRDDFH